MRALFKDGVIWNEPCGKPSRPSFRIALKLRHRRRIPESPVRHRGAHRLLHRAVHGARWSRCTVGARSVHARCTEPNTDNVRGLSGRNGRTTNETRLLFGLHIVNAD